MDGQIAQFASSLIAIFALAGLAWAMGLGGKPTLCDDDAVQHAANEAWDGFKVTESVIDAKGVSALARDEAGQIMLIKRHGNRFAGRVLDNNAHAETLGQKLTVDCSEPRFGIVELELVDPAPWAEAINQLGSSRDA